NVLAILVIYAVIKADVPHAVTIFEAGELTKTALSVKLNKEKIKSRAKILIVNLLKSYESSQNKTYNNSLIQFVICYNAEAQNTGF
ncbi:hypothetical protein JKY79_01250, partial [Candidatus Babeliales bacterium]|nr:hypothetical protein [Candidatus Babeliales bacterium]